MGRFTSTNFWCWYALLEFIAGKAIEHLDPKRPEIIKMISAIRKRDGDCD
jgi:hypothetical protein